MAGRFGTDLRHGVRIAGIEVRRSVRSILASRRQLLGLSFMLLAFTPAGFLFVSGSYAAGTRLADGTTMPVVTLARAQITAWLGSMTALFGLRMVERAGDIDHADLMLTTVRPRAVVTGLVLAEYLRILAVFLTPIAFVVGAFAYGAGTPLMVPVVVVGLLPILAVALAGGFVLAYAVRLLYRRLGWGDVPQTGIVLVVMVAFVLGINVYLPDDTSRILYLFEPLSVVPIGPYADFLLVASPFAVTPGLESIVAAGLVFGAFPVLLGVAWRLGPAVWYGDGEAATTEEADASADSPRFGGVGAPGPLGATRTTRLVWWQWLRGLRSPGQFVHLLYFLFMGFPILQYTFEHPRSAVLPMFVAVLGAFLAGGTFGLNPLGIEGSMLPAIVTTPSPGRTLVRARVLAGALLWLPLALFLIVGLGWFSSLGTVDVAFVAVLAVALTWFSCTLALALGAAAPRFESVRAFGGVEAPTPTTVALLGHSFLTAILAALGFAAVFVPTLYDGPPFSGTTVLLARLVGLAFWTASIGAIGAICYRYAIRRVNAFTYE
jgi:ABC-2 type transport system permease protein